MRHFVNYKYKSVPKASRHVPVLQRSQQNA